MPNLTNAWGEPIEVVEDPTDLYYVPPAERKDTDDDPDANALQSDPFDPDSLDDDLGDWTPE
jgi:hypothetical protein